MESCPTASLCPIRKAAWISFVFCLAMRVPAMCSCLFFNRSQPPNARVQKRCENQQQMQVFHFVNMGYK